MQTSLVLQTTLKAIDLALKIHEDQDLKQELYHYGIVSHKSRVIQNALLLAKETLEQIQHQILR